MNDCDRCLVLLLLLAAFGCERRENRNPEVPYMRIQHDILWDKISEYEKRLGRLEFHVNGLETGDPAEKPIPVPIN